MSDFSIAELLLFQLFLILLNAVFACAEIAVISINEIKLKKLAEDGNRGALRLLSLTAQPAKFLATIQVGITLAGFLGSAFAADNFSDKIVDWLVSLGISISPAKLDVLSVIGITFVLSYVTLILGELVPKRIAMQSAEKIALSMSGVIYFIAKIFAPLVWLLTASTNLVLRLCGINPEEKNENITEEEIRIMVDAGSEIGIIDDTEKDLIHNIFEFDDKLAEEVMTHRTEVTFLNINDSFETWEKSMIDTRYSVYPVFQDKRDNVIGTISIKDYFKFKGEPREKLLEHALKPVQFINELCPIDDLFKIMQRSRNHFAVIVDEYGSMEGIVTMNDLLEELVGDLEDDVSAPPLQPMIEQIKQNIWRVRGIAPIDDVQEDLHISIPVGDYDTFAGFVFSLMGSIPKSKKNIRLTYKNIKMKILHIKGRRIEDVLVQLTDKAGKGAND